MKGDHEITVKAVGQLSPTHNGDAPVRFPRQANIILPPQLAFHLKGQSQGDILFSGPIGTRHAGILSPVTGIEHNHRPTISITR